MAKRVRKLGLATREEIQKARASLGDSSERAVLMSRARAREKEMSRQLTMYASAK